jgi:stearoyl-CoA desaturase (delta-9 desaturase)
MHRHHHRSSDGPDDLISPVQHGYSWTQLHLWIATRHPLVGKRIHDFDDFPELLWLERHWWVAPVGWATSMYALGAALAAAAPPLGTSGAQLLVFGGILANAYIIQTASLVNAACHRFGSQPFDTGDGSRNNGWVSLVAVGEGWHNNHHRYPWAASNRVEWWQLDPVYGVLRMLAWLGLVWDLRLPGPARASRPGQTQRGPA